MDERLATLQLRNDEILDLLEDPELPPLDRQQLNEEMLRNTVEITTLEFELRYGDDRESTLSYVSCESIGRDEYEREGIIVNDDFDLANEI